MSELYWQPAYIALGSNLDTPEAQVAHAITLLARIDDTRVASHSSLYRSQPMGKVDQPWFINAVAGVLTRLAPAVLLTALQDIERQMGRVRVQHWGPRIIDLDLLLLGNSRVQSPQLQLPHPGLLERNFVITPLSDIAPTLMLPNGRTAAQMVVHLGNVGLERVS